MQRIIFMIVPLLICLLAFRPVNTVTVKGKITNAAGAPVAGMNISEKGKVAYVTSANDGSFQLTVSNTQATLVISGIGYITQEVSLQGNSVLEITAVPVPAREFSKEPATALQGNVAGILVGGYSSANRTVRRQATGSGMIAEDRYVQEIPKQNFNTEDYDHITETKFLSATENPLSTFSIDVDAASYSNVRRYLNQGMLPPAGAVRIEEMINYFRYDYPRPANEHPFSINTEMANAPWNTEHKLVLIGLQGRKIPTANLPASNLVFLIDVSGSMSDENKLPLVKASMKLLVDQLREQDKVSIVVYAGAAGLVLSPTSGEKKTKIREAIDNLEAGGSTAGGEGLRLAYKAAKETFIKGGNNRVILCTDGDFNVGESSNDAMERLVEAERRSGIFLTVLGYGMGNYKDSKMQILADKGNGNHAYIDGFSEAKKVLVNEFGGTLFTIAKDVKLQVEFNPAVVQAYRLIGYENRMLAKEDFNNDKKDAGELGSGHTVTALYEIIPVGVKSAYLNSVDPLKYQKTQASAAPGNTDEMFTVKFRYKAPDGDTSKLLQNVVLNKPQQLEKTSDNFRFAAAVAELGMLLRQSEFKGAASYEQVIGLAKAARGTDEEGYRAEFIRLVSSAKLIAKEEVPVRTEESVGKR